MYSLVISLFKLILTGALLISVLGGCSVQHQLLNRAADLLSAETISTDDDLELLMHASAYQLKLSESLLQKIPDHIKLAEAVTRGYTQYAFVFLMDEADRAESESIQIATKLRIRATNILLRAKSHGLQTLSLNNPNLTTYLSLHNSNQSPTIKPDQSGLGYWTVAAWAGAISLSKDNPDVVADLPQVLRLADLIWKSNPQFDNGSLASLMGTLEMAKPSGQSAVAERYFNQAIQWRNGQPGPLVSKAENWAVPAQDKVAFTSLLNQAILDAQGKKDVASLVMLRRAHWLLSCTDDLF